jgi:hypothetical protein
VAEGNTVIAPTVGRVVLFVHKRDCYEFGFCIIAGRPHAATVAAVHSNRLVNLSIADANGKQFNRTSVTLRQPGEPEPGGDYCEWMPYQIDQAAKHAAA